jgi:cellobiose phosphorylase
MNSRALKEDGRITLIEYPFMTRDFRINYFTSNLPASSFETDRREFLGDNEYGTWRAPLSLQKAELGCHEANRGDVMAALMLPLGILQPGETRSFVTLLGQASNKEEAASVIERYCREEAVEEAFAELQHAWEGRLEPMQVETPDADLNRMVNIFNLRQCWTTFYWSRYLSYYQLGYGARGIGTRDSSQDVLAMMPSGADQAKELILKLLAIQRRDGSAYHQFNPLSLVASEGESLEREDRPHYYSDDHLWGALAVTEYLKETGDYTFLNEPVAFYDKDKQEKPIEVASVLIHLQRGLEFTRTHTGLHGLPLLGFADWNDTVNLPAGAESLFTANLYGRALSAMISLMQVLGKPEEAAKYQTDYEVMQKIVEDSAWDGAWYRRYFDAEGNPLGSSTNTYGKIYINAQSWAVLSGFASPEHGRQAMDSVYERLNTKFGIKLSAPGYNGFDSNVGGITSYPPGAKENGGIFLHTNPWAIIAETRLGRGDRAFQYYCQINPARRNEDIEGYECEPYVYPQNILGDEHPQFGLARNSWLSGTSSWTYQAATQYILGIRADYDGLVIDPCIPSSWESFSVRRRFRGAWYNIHVVNPRRVNRGVTRLFVDGVEVNQVKIPVFASGTEHKVEVWLGETEN